MSHTGQVDLKAQEVSDNDTMQQVKQALTSEEEGELVQATLQNDLQHYRRGDNPKHLASLGLRVITDKALDGKIKGLGLNRRKAEKLHQLTEELVQRLTQTHKKELPALKQDMNILVREWGLPASTLTKTRNYKVIARLIAYCVMLTR